MSDWWEKRLGDSEWFFFYTAANVIADALGISGGMAQRRLRELCSNGDVRSKQAVNTDDRGWRDEPIKPSEWTDELDIEWSRREDVLSEVRPIDPDDPEYGFTSIVEDGGPVGVMVNAEDFRYWLSKQPAAPPGKSPPRHGKVPLIIDYLKEMFPGKLVPDPAFCSRKKLKADLLEKDQERLFPLDVKTLKDAVDQYNLLIGNERK